MIALSIFAAGVLAASPFDSPRAKLALESAEKSLREEVKKLSVAFPPKQILLRAYKHERILEVWVGDRNKMLRLLTSYPFTAASGKLGPKRAEGDLQVPEGFYLVNRFNPNSRFFLSMGINYPNASDQVRSNRKSPGGEIFIHGDAKSIGCIAIGDLAISELYSLCGLSSLSKGGTVHVHIFPFRMEPGNLRHWSGQHSLHANFWNELVPIYDAFEKSRVLPQIKVSRNGQYILR